MGLIVVNGLDLPHTGYVGTGNTVGKEVLLPIYHLIVLPCKFF